MPRVQERNEVILKTSQINLRLRVAEAGVEFEDFRPAFCEHDSGVNDAPVINALDGATAKPRFNDQSLHFGELRRAHKSQWADCSHAAGILAFIAVERFLMVPVTEGRAELSFRRRARGATPRRLLWITLVRPAPLKSPLTISRLTLPRCTIGSSAVGRRSIFMFGLMLCCFYVNLLLPKFILSLENLFCKVSTSVTYVKEV